MEKLGLFLGRFGAAAIYIVDAARVGHVAAA